MSNISSIHAKESVFLTINMQYYCTLPYVGLFEGHSYESHKYYFDRVWTTVVPSISVLQKASQRLGIQRIFTCIESLTFDGKDSSLLYKQSKVNVPLGHWHARVLSDLYQDQQFIYIPKTSCSVFNSTNIAYVLRNLNAKHLIIAGVMTNQCVESAVRDAADLGFLVTLVVDAIACDSHEAHVASLKAMEGFCRLVTSEQILNELSAANSSLQRETGIETETKTELNLSSPTSSVIAAPTKIALLQTDTYSAYGQNIVPLFIKLFSGRVRFEVYNVTVGCFPSITEADNMSGFLIPGSFSSVNDSDVWIQDLKQWVVENKHRSLFGVCFGHQLIAAALGGCVEQNPKGFQTSLKHFTLTALPDSTQDSAVQCVYPVRLILHSPPTLHNLPYGSLAMFCNFGDYVRTVPSDAVCIAESAIAPVMGMQIGSNILTVQGHPEFATPFGRHIARQRIRAVGMDGRCSSKILDNLLSLTFPEREGPDNAVITASYIVDAVINMWEKSGS